MYKRLCPTCNAQAKSTERRPNGFSTCENGHKHLTSEFDTHTRALEMEEMKKQHAESVKNDPRFKAFNDFDNHIILYAKGWYKESSDVMEDVRTIVAKVSLLERKYVSDTDIVMLVADTMYKIFAIEPMTMGDRDTLYKEVWRDWSPGKFGSPKHSLTAADIVTSHLSVIRHRNFTCCPPLKLDPEILPLDKEDGIERLAALNK